MMRASTATSRLYPLARQCSCSGGGRFIQLCLSAAAAVQSEDRSQVAGQLLSYCPEEANQRHRNKMGNFLVRLFSTLFFPPSVDPPQPPIGPPALNHDATLHLFRRMHINQLFAMAAISRYWRDQVLTACRQRRYLTIVLGRNSKRLFTEALRHPRRFQLGILVFPPPNFRPTHGAERGPLYGQSSNWLLLDQPTLSKGECHLIAHRFINLQQIDLVMDALFFSQAYPIMHLLDCFYGRPLRINLWTYTPIDDVNPQLQAYLTPDRNLRWEAFF